MENLVLGIISLTALSLAGLMSLASRGILFFALNTDEEKQVKGAAEFGKGWWFPSDLHKFSGGKAWLKDIGVLGLVIFQRILGDKQSNYPLVVFCNFVTSLSSILLYILARQYFGTEIALLVFFLFISSWWPYQIALASGYQCLAVALFLIFVLMTQHQLFFFAGLALGAMMFSSASARKLIPMIFIAFFYSQRDLMHLPWFDQGFYLAWGLASAIGIPIMIYFFSPLILKMIFRLFGTTNLEKHSISRMKITFILSLLFILWDAYLLGCYVTSAEASFYLAPLYILGGSILVAGMLMLPNISRSIKGFISYWNIPKWGGHAKLHDKFFLARIGRPLKENAGGILMDILLYWRISPLFCSLLLLTLPIFLYHVSFLHGSIFSDLAILLTGLSPIIYSEITGAPKHGKSFFPTIIGILLIIAYAFFIIKPGPCFWMSLIPFLVLNALWNMWLLFNDILPARMLATYLERALQQRSIKVLYTYDTPHNNVLTKPLERERGGQYQIKYIKSLNEVTDGWVVVPPTAAKTCYWQSSPDQMESGDFREDPVLNKLLDTRTIGNLAAARFKSMSASRYWVLDGAVMSYCDLILHDITPGDRWLGWAWLLDGKKLQAHLLNKGRGV